MKKTPVISIVDDDYSVRAAMENLLAALGYVAHTFATAEQFLESPQIHLTSCLISDVQMPRLGGMELQDLLLGRGYQFPIIFITAYPKTVEQLRAIEAGAVCILEKPLDNEALITQLQNALKL